MAKRRGKKVFLVVGAVLLLVAAIGFLFGKQIFKSVFFDTYYRSDEPVVAIFDRTKTADNIDAAGIDHYKVVWKDGKNWNDPELEKVMARHDVLVTVETWPDRSPANVLDEVLRGRFDKRIKQLSAIAAKSRYKVFVRLNPDMEVPATIYPWQYQSSDTYSKSFNYFAEKLKRLAPAVKMVWGPSGYPGDTEYWPGNKYVDFVSITLGSVSEYTMTAYPFAKTVPDILRQKLHRLRFINKPVLILGTNTITKENFKKKWITDQAAYMAANSNVEYSSINYVDTGKIKPVRDLLKVGVFDPNKRLLHQKNITVEHIFVDLGNVQRGEFEKDFKQIVDRGHDAIVTMEPWRDTTANTSDSMAVRNVLSGKYDPLFRRLFKIISSTNRTVYLRWMHEMEIPIHRYAWQSQDPVTYIKAYRYFMQFEGGPGKNVKKVWGPAGDRGSIDFWPGDDVIDYISIAIYGLPDKNITDPTKQEPFSKIFNRKFHRMRFSARPLFITEFGVKGPESYQDMWLADAANTIKANKHVFGICYFNLYDNPKAWGNIKAPDWSITPRSMNKFCEAINTETR